MMKINGRIVAAIAIAIVLFGLLAGCGQQQTNVPQQPTTPAQKETEPAYPETALYYNVDWALYNRLGSEGSSSRPKDKDGKFTIRFMDESGKLVTFVAPDRAMVNRIDTMPVLGLELSGSDITGILDVSHIYACDGYLTYVKEAKDTTVLSYTNAAFVGSMRYDSVLATGAVIHDMSGQTQPLGGSTQLRKNDQFLALRDQEGKICRVYILAREEMEVLDLRYCAHCEKDVAWSAWNNTKDLPKTDSGHFYLTCDVTLKGQVTMVADAKIILDLNGHTVQGAADSRVFSLHNEGCYLALLDSSTNQTGKVIAGAATDIIHEGIGVWVRYGTFDMYGGTLDVSKVTSIHHGTAVYVRTKTEFNMYGGTIIGGTTHKNPSADKGGKGGAVFVDGMMFLFGGTITGGTAEDGGSIYVDSGAFFGMVGGTVTGGTSPKGCISNYGTMELSGGTVQGNVYQNGEKIS